MASENPFIKVTARGRERNGPRGPIPGRRLVAANLYSHALPADCGLKGTHAVHMLNGGRLKNPTQTEAKEADTLDLIVHLGKPAQRGLRNER